MTRRAPAVLALLVFATAASARPARKLRGETAQEPPPAPVVLLHPPRVSTEPITVVWPPEGLAMAGDGEFILGSVASTTVPFRVNGVTVTAHPDGGFLAFLPVASGTFTFRAELDLPAGTTAYERRILVAGPPPPLPPGKTVIDPASLSPKSELELRAGDWLTARMRGTPGKSARVRAGKGPWHDMREGGAGSYDASWQIAPGEEFSPAPLEYELGSGWSSVKAKGSALVSASGRALAVATVKANPAGFISVKTGPANGFLAFPPPGTRFAVTGKEGGSWRVQLAANLSGWVEAKDVELSAGAPPRPVVGAIGVVALSSASVVRLGLSERAAFTVEADDDLGGLTVRLYGAVGHTNNVIYDLKDDFLDEVRWSQEASDIVAVRLLLKPGRALWGWHAAYDGAGPSLRVELRRPPSVDGRRPLAGLKVMLDPGHMPSATGATGPLGTKEMDANYALALAAEERLRREGAVVLVTRSSPTHEVSLVERPKQALERGADLFVSLHNNALPDGSNPFAKTRGFTVYYYHPQSLELARSVHDAYAARAPVPDEGLQWANFLVARLPAIPAILVENAYMILPEQEAVLNDPAARGRFAEALVAGLRDFVKRAGHPRR